MKTRYAIGFGKVMLSLCYSTMLPLLCGKNCWIILFGKQLHFYINHCSLFIIILFSKIFRHPIKDWKQNNVPNLVLKSKERICLLSHPAKSKTLCHLGHKALVTNAKQLTDGAGICKQSRGSNHIPVKIC